jgi:hypothetical protein
MLQTSDITEQVFSPLNIILKKLLLVGRHTILKSIEEKWDLTNILLMLIILLRDYYMF